MMRQHSINELLLAVRRLPPRTPLSDQLSKGSYDTHQDHWVCWLSEYNSGGYYGRADTNITDARTVYNRLNNGPILIWLAEGLRLPPATIHQAFVALRSAILADKNKAARAGAVRRIIPWEMIARYLG